MRISSYVTKVLGLRDDSFPGKRILLYRHSADHPKSSESKPLGSASNNELIRSVVVNVLFHGIRKFHRMTININYFKLRVTSCKYPDDIRKLI